jgi:uncharacterized protein (DUF4415 family)
MQTQSKTDKKRLKKMSDKDINLDNIPELDDKFFKSAQLQLPNKQAVTMRLDSDVLEWFKKQGKGYQTRINQLLRKYMETHQSPR